MNSAPPEARQPPTQVHLRLFLGLGLPPRVRDQLAGCACPMPGARWVPPEQLHLTLRFLGRVAAADLPALTDRLGGVRAPAFDLALGGVGQFPAGPRQPPRVLWARVTPAAPVQALKRAIDGALGPDPEERDRGFSPHVTLARLKEDPGVPGPLAAFRERHRGLGSPPFPVRSFRLYQSRTLPSGSEYLVLAEYPLG